VSCFWILQGWLAVSGRRVQWAGPWDGWCYVLWLSWSDVDGSWRWDLRLHHQSVVHVVRLCVVVCVWNVPTVMVNVLHNNDTMRWSLARLLNLCRLRSGTGSLRQGGITLEATLLTPLSIAISSNMSSSFTSSRAERACNSCTIWCVHPNMLILFELCIDIYPACACAVGVKQCLLVGVCRQKNFEKCFKQGCGIYRHHSQQKTISIIRLGHFCTWYKPRWFFMPYFIYFLLSFSWLHPFQNHTWY